MDLVPKYMFFTKGVGVHKHQLASFELALRAAGIEKQNLVCVSSIYPPHCQEIVLEKGLQLLKPGAITFCVMAKMQTNEANRLIAASVGLAVPKDKNRFGYLSEYHNYGITADKAGDIAEDIAAELLGTTMGIEVDSNLAWSEKEQVYKASGQIIKTKNITQSSMGNKDGKWTTVLSTAIFIL